MRRPVRLRPVRPAGWWFDVLLLAAAAALTLALANGLLLDVDLAVRDWVNDHRPPAAYWVARVVNFLGQGGQVLLPVALLLAAAVARRARSVRPVLVVAAAVVLTYLVVGVLKLWTDRAAPSSPTLPPEQSVLIFNPNLPPGEYDLSYPSGHVANAVVWYGVFALLLTALTAGRLRRPVSLAIRVLPPVIVLITTTYLNFHWLTDGIVALLVGVVLDRLIARVPWDDVPLPALPRGLDRPGLFTWER